MKVPETSKTAAARSLRRKPPAGGKALARLRQFEHERALIESDVVEGRTDRPLAREAKATKATARRVREGYPYLAAFESMQQMRRTAPAVAVQQGWRPLGPFSVPHGQTYGIGPGSRPSVAGRLAAVAVDPGNAAHILIGAAGGGVWETMDTGATWEPRTDNQPSLAIGAIAFDPTNLSIVYAGTGEGNFYARLGSGLLRSTDGGTTWAVHATSPFVSAGFYALVVDSLNSNHLLAATTLGLYESTNGGTTWTQRRSVRTWDISMHPPVAGDASSTQEVLAACQDGLFRSTNGGTAWIAVALPGTPASGYSRLAVRHAPSDGDVAIAFAAGVNGSGHFWRRAAFGGAFTAAATPPGLETGQAWYDWFAAVAPNNPDVVYLGAIEVHRGVRSATNTWTWATISATTSDSIHPDQHAIAFSPVDPNVVYVGNDGGIYRSPNGGTNWRSLNKHLCITEFEYLAQHPLWEAYLLGGTQDNGTLRYEGEEVWYHVQDGDGGDCGVNAGTPATCFHTFYNMGLERSTSGGGWGSWSWIGPNVPSTYQSLFYPPVEVNGNLVAQAGTSVFVSLNNGTAWAEVALPQPAAGIATALAVPTTTRIYAGTTAGHIYRIEFTSGAWGAPTQLTRPRTGYVSDIAVDPTNANRLWATYSNIAGGHVFRSDDGGTTWTDFSAGLPTIPVNAIVIDPAAPSTVFVAADVGVYRSTNAGASWTAFNNLLPNALVADLVFFEPLRLLRAGTRNRGVWEIGADAPTMPDVELYLRDSVVDTGRRSPSPSGVNDPFSVGSVTHWWQCTDIKLDSPSYQTPAAADVDFERFEDDHGLAAAGLIHENAQRGRLARVFVQLHNRGSKAAANVAVKVFYADASLGLPDLPSGFWTSFPNNALPAASPWREVAPHKVVASVEADRPQVVAFDWPVSGAAAGHTCLLAIISANDDQIATSELTIATLVTGNKKCGLKNLTVVDPPPVIGPRSHAVLLNLWKQRRWKSYELGLDRRSTPILAGLVLSRHLSELAKAQGEKGVRLTEEQRTELAKLIRLRPDLKEMLDTAVAYQPAAKGPWLRSITLEARKPEPVVALIGPRPRRGKLSLVQWAEDGTVVGGYTLQVLGGT
ncbi:MAG: hypothetical protein M3546_04455 [Actinomycetota bacterium]|nr:hypothetical protein [Actinomycetota bacterium]